MRFVIAAAAIVVFTGLAMGQQPYAGLQHRPIKTFLTNKLRTRMLVAAWAFSACRLTAWANAIELADQLHLSPEQATKVKTLFEFMTAETIPLGASLISQERDLNNKFESRTITVASLEAITKRIGATQAALRAAHLKYHLSTVAILTLEQVARYNELRGYKADEAPTHGHHQKQQ